MTNRLTIFLSYTQSVGQIDHANALRFQTIAALYGITVHLPSFFVDNKDDLNSKKIADASYTVIFASIGIDDTIATHIKTSRTKKRPIIAFIPDSIEHTPLLNQHELVRYQIGYGVSEHIMHDVARSIDSHFKKSKIQAKDSNVGQVLLTALAVGVGIWALSSLVNEYDSSQKR